ncbi:MAG: DUF3656 domain-containing protein [Eubacteriales bacterium]|nr:DUF3656 domain-containing protein [Eubacteriales bacterium]
MKAAVNAGADAVYMGGSRFGARAYADNPQEDQFLEAIDFVHLHGCSLYMTVNTLMKEEELNQLYEFLLPYYERGLDAVIVQDLGVFDFIRRHFPKLPVHASTQMTVTGWRSAKLLKDMGASRVVTARELSLDEIAAIRDHVDIEIESFVHGALCYCYSGQCLLSSLIGGRSGNRGRCAQPCRLPYESHGDSRGTGKKNPQGKQYLMSLKDLCTLDILPDIVEAGVFSLKIEGRMKSPRYTAGVVSVYRKYLDRYLEYGREGYKVDQAARRMLLDLFDRGGLTEGYYRQHNGRDMIALKEKPAFREGNQALFDRLDAEYVNLEKQEPARARVTVREGEPSRLELSARRGPDGASVCVTVSGEAAQTAQNQPLTGEKLLKQMNRTGGSPFYFEELTETVEGNCFLPVQALNRLRRDGMDALTEAVLSPYRRRRPEEEPDGRTAAFAQDVSGRQCGGGEDGFWPEISVSLEQPETFPAAVRHRDVTAVYLDSTGFGGEDWAGYVKACHDAGKICGLILPHIFRREAEAYFYSHRDRLKEAGFDVFVIRSMEEPEFLRELGLGFVPFVLDANLYAMNHQAARFLKNMGAERLTMPLELNSRELEALACDVRLSDIPWELTAYGRYPAMVSAQCILRTTKGCTKKPELLYIQDRTGKQLPVKNHCRFCYNTIYNPSPLSLLGQEQIVKRLRPDVLRLSFTTETPKQAREVLDAYADCFLRGEDVKAPFGDFTRGHMKRGVE